MPRFFIVIEVDDAKEFKELEGCVRGALEGTRFTPPAPRATTMEEKLRGV